MFLHNCWYVIAWPHEVTADRLLARKICNISVVLFRRKDGNPAALRDRCWHRYAPLSMGRLENDTIICGYHGLTFNGNGKCVHMPNQERIPDSVCVRSYPVLEKHGFIWIWMGEIARMDESIVPDLHWNKDPDWRGKGGLLYLQCDYRLLMDNLMDLTHETYVHPTTIGHEKLPMAPIETESDDTNVMVTRWIEDHQPPPFWRNAIRNEYDTEENCDRWQIIRYLPPSNITLNVGVAITGTGAREGNLSRGVNGYVINAITPETETSTHYFWNFVRNFDLDNEALTQHLHDTNAGVFLEDRAMLEAQQKIISESDEVRLASMNIDAGGKRARLILERLINALP